MLKNILSCLIIAIILFSGHPEADELDAGQVLQEIKQNGPRSVIISFFGESLQKSDQLTDSISTGKKEWLEIARILRRESDAAASELLDYAVSLALPKNPIGVLTLFKTEPDNFILDRICRDPYYEDTVDLATEEKFLKDAENALVYMYDPTQDKELDAFRWQCLERIRRDLRIVEKDKDKYTVPEKPITVIPPASSLPKQDGSPPE